MTNTFSLNAQARELQGKGASRRLRHQSLVPAVIYGGSAAAQSISIPFKELGKALESEAFYSPILTPNVDVQAVPMHADFLRVDATHQLVTRVPLHFTNQETAIGVKQQGGAVSIIATDVEISTLPANLPEFIEVDMSAVEVGTTLHLSDIKLPAGVSIPALAQGHDHDQAIANIHAVHSAE